MLKLKWFVIGMTTSLGIIGIFLSVNLMVWPPPFPRLAYAFGGGGNHLSVHLEPGLDKTKIVVLVSRPLDEQAVVFEHGKYLGMPWHYGTYRFTLRCGDAEWVVGGHLNFGRWNFHKYKIVCKEDGPSDILCDFSAIGEYNTRETTRLLGAESCRVH